MTAGNANEVNWLRILIRANGREWQLDLPAFSDRQCCTAEILDLCVNALLLKMIDG